MERSHRIVLPQTRGLDSGGESFGDLCGVLSADYEVIGMFGGRMSGKGKHYRETVGALHLSTLES